jgi:glycerophosphoryl diester phosphodiesterase
MWRIVKWLTAMTGLLALAAFALNTNMLGPPSTGHPVLLAHRGLAQTFHREGLTSETCTATRIHEPEHAYLENTLASIRAAFDAGADIVEFDVHPTTDGHFAVFHDWTLECRTNGKGVTREHTLADLKALDVGFGYTADGGKTYPFRGHGVGLMPSLDEVLTAFSDRRLLINVKSNDASEGEKLAEVLHRLPPERLAQLAVYGGDAPMAVLRDRVGVKTMSRASLKACAFRYLGLGWSGVVPAACRNTIVLLPVNYAPMVWGWPNRFLARLQSAGTDVYVTGPLSGGDPGTSGIDDAEMFRRLPAGFSGGIWTNRIDRIAPLARPRLGS